jgi:phenylacetate-coenzyme A ligase PaaK-like adenylate-forming protein
MSEAIGRMDGLAPRPGDLDPIETASRDAITALQSERLRWSLAHAYENVPHYRRAFDAAGVRPEDLREPGDLRRFPFTAKADLRASASRASMPPPAPRESPPWSAIPRATSRPGRT